MVGSDFRPDLSIAMSQVSMLKREIFREGKGLTISQPNSNRIGWNSIYRARETARRAEVAGNSGYVSVIDELTRTGMQK